MRWRGWAVIFLYCFFAVGERHHKKPIMLVSVVIITKNEAHIIGKTLQSLQGLTNDIVIVDSGSTDETLDICKKFNTRIIQTTWDGYGNNKNKGIAIAKNDWILSLDADESIDEVLKSSILQLESMDAGLTGKINFRNYFCNKWIRFGEWSGDKHIRLFNRKVVKWNTAAVHEGLLFMPENKMVALKGNILHYTSNSLEDHIHKTIGYAKLNAQHYFNQGRRAGFFKLRLSPALNFLQHYIFGLGFLDGWEGYFIARTSSWYTFLKYSYLRELNRNNKIQ